MCRKVRQDLDVFEATDRTPVAVLMKIEGGTSVPC